MSAARHAATVGALRSPGRSPANASAASRSGSERLTSVPRANTLETLTNVFAGYGADQVLGSWRQQVPMESEQRLAVLLKTERSGFDSGAREESDDSSSDSSDSLWNRGGLRYWAPGLYRWLAPRVGSRERFLIAFTFSVVEGTKERALDFAGHEINYLSIQVVASVISLLCALAISFFMEGQWGASRIFCFSALWRWSFVGFFFAAKSVMLTYAYQSGLHHMILMLVGFLYVIVAAVGSFFVFSRKYGKLEWLSLSMLILSAPAFYIMRERCDTNYCQFFDFTKDQLSLLGIICAFVGVAMAAVASILAERLFKNFSSGMVRRNEQDNFDHGKYYIHRVHLDFTNCVLLGVVWIWQYYCVQGSWNSKTDVMFGYWTRRHYILVAIYVLQAWWAGLVVMNFSTVTKSLLQTVVGVLSVCIVDPLAGMTYGHNFGIRAVPSLLIAVIIVICAVLFQTGRLNMKAIREASGVPAQEEVGGIQSVRRFFCRERTQTRTPEAAAQSGGLMKYCLPVLYIVSNALQTELQNTVSANRFFVPQSLQVGIPLCGMGLASALTLNIYGLKGLREALDPRTLNKFLLLGLMQSVVGALAGLAMGLGINSSLYVAMGKIYTPLSLVLGRLILHRRYLWIEWLSVVVLFVASITLAFLDSSIATHSAGRKSSAVAILSTAGSASMACIYSVIMEIALQNTTTPFLVNKIRLDFGAFLWGIAFLPVMGFLGVSGGRPDLAFWVYRPNNYWDCVDIGSCDDAGLFVATNATAAQANDCFCGKGVFLGWSSWVVYAALGAGVLYGWLTGKIIEHFSTVMRSVLDGFPIMLLQFCISPLASRIPLDDFEAKYPSPLPFINRDWAKDLMTIVNPISAITYIEAAAQVKKVAELCHPHEIHEDEALEVNGELDTDGETESSESSDAAC
ncbi:unnamed protein product [Effrenium voratum]|uniref:Uncharacterized protein n=1 Tax=Effrenium voratum TaxID=2562239 RepID=A0AA36IX98_9DINO|nr:unnamed protein product [Effrenium voratum]